MAEKSDSKSLNPKQRLFIEEYLTCWNASEAARRAKYSHPGQQGHRLLKNVEISAEIERRLADKAMSADEVLARLTDMARADIRSLVITNKSGSPTGFNLGSSSPLHLVKKVSVTSQGITIELHDAQAALVKLGEYHKLFQKLELSGPNGKPLFENLSQVKDELVRRFSEIASGGETATVPQQPDAA